MQAEIGRRKLQMRGNPECGSQLAQSSIHIGSESATSRQEIAAFATSFRHSAVASEARYTRRGGRGSIGDRR
jgi:hypothetical protein